MLHRDEYKYWKPEQAIRVSLQNEAVMREEEWIIGKYIRQKGGSGWVGGRRTFCTTCHAMHLGARVSRVEKEALLAAWDHSLARQP